MSNFAAPAQALGYLYQVRYALLLLLKAENDVDLLLEGLDDISLEERGSPLELIQTKHHSKIANLTDSSTDLWKSLRIWCHRFTNGEIGKNVILSLISNETCAPGSVADLLSSESSRNIDSAKRILDSIAASSTNKSNEDAYKDYLNLNDRDRLDLLGSCYIISRSPDIDEVMELICRKIEFATRPEFLDDFLKRLEGWWLRQAIVCLRQKKIISKKELSAEVYFLADQYRADSLPIHEFTESVPELPDIEGKHSNFIEQLKLIGVKTGRLNQAISNYYRAFHQRSKWLRDGSLYVGELSKYERDLFEEWLVIFNAMKDEISEEQSEEELKKAGREVLNRIETELKIHIRPRATEPFIMRGTYHILANRGSVGWHPQFDIKLRHLFEKAMGEALEPNDPNI